MPSEDTWFTADSPTVFRKNVGPSQSMRDARAANTRAAWDEAFDKLPLLLVRLRDYKHSCSNVWHCD